MASNACHQSGYIRTVPVLSVAKKLAAPRPSSDSTCGQHVPADEGAWSGLTVNSCWKTLALLLLFFFSLLEVMTGRWELTECSKLTCFAKRMLDMVPGDSGKWDRWSLSATVRDRRRTCQVESELGRGKIGLIRRIQAPKKKKKPSSTHESKCTNESNSRTEADVRSTNCCVHACMHYAQLRSCSACFVSVELGLSLVCVCFNGRNVGKAPWGAKNPAETRTTPTAVKSTSKWAILPN